MTAGALRSRALWPTLLAVIAALLLTVPAPAVAKDVQGRAAQTAPPAQRPDVIVIMTDDQRVGTEKAMPFLWDQLRPQMTHYPNAQVPNNNCCPARSSFLTGRFSHSTGVWDNTEAGAPGGWLEFNRRGSENRTLATALQPLGYATSLLGKYLNQYYLFNDPAVDRPPGWTDFRTYLHSNGGYWTDVHPLHGVAPGYTTDVLGDAAADVIRTTPAEQPLFLLYTPYAPHDPATPGPYDGRAAETGALDAFRIAGQWDNPSVGEQNRADKPPWVRAVRPLATDLDPTIPYPKVRKITEDQSDTLLGVDANIAKIVRAQREARDWDNTMVVFMSDNGVAWGDHALFDKTTPYRLANAIPLLIKYPAAVGKQPDTDPRLVNQLDVTATITQLTGATLATAGHSTLAPASRQGLLLHSPASKKGYPYWHPAYCGWRTDRAMYARYGDGSEELYLYDSDPFELTNQAADPRYRALRARMSWYAHVSCQPKPPGYRAPRLRLHLTRAPRMTRATVRPGATSSRLQVQRLRGKRGWVFVGNCVIKDVTPRKALRSFQVAQKGRYRVRVRSAAFSGSGWSRPLTLRASASRFRCI